MVTFSYVRALSVSMWKKSWLKCIILTIAYSLKSVGIVTECISDHNDTNKRNNCLNLIFMLNDFFITRSHSLFHDGGRYHIETSPLICRVMDWFLYATGSVMKELNKRVRLMRTRNVVKLKWINYQILDVSWMIQNVTERYFFFS